MKISDILKELPLGVKSFKDGIQRDFTDGYVSDLLSDVLANSKKGDLWITLQTHPNIVAIGSYKGSGRDHHRGWKGTSKRNTSEGRG
jgi:hypothetical protein